MLAEKRCSVLPRCRNPFLQQVACGILFYNRLLAVGCFAKYDRLSCACSPDTCLFVEIINSLFATFRFSWYWILGYGTGTKGAGGAGTLQTSGKVTAAPLLLAFEFTANITQLLVEVVELRLTIYLMSI
jgi:hypothetical protein